MESTLFHGLSESEQKSRRDKLYKYFYDAVRVYQSNPRTTDIYRTLELEVRFRQANVVHQRKSKIPLKQQIFPPLARTNFIHLLHYLTEQCERISDENGNTILDIIYANEDQTRIRINGPTDIQSYCQTGSVTGCDFIAMQKLKRIKGVSGIQGASIDENYLQVMDISEANIRFAPAVEVIYKNRERYFSAEKEEKMNKEYRKTYRLKRLYQFKSANGHWLFDLSISRVSKSPTGRGSSTMSNILDSGVLSAPEEYELEMEWIGYEDAPLSQTELEKYLSDELTQFYKQIHWVQAIIQDQATACSTYERNKTILQYAQQTEQWNDTSLDVFLKEKLPRLVFMGPQPNTLGLKQWNTVLKKQSNYMLTEKADGNRAFMFCADIHPDRLDIMLMDRNNNVIHSGSMITDPDAMDAFQGTMLDGEYMPYGNAFYAFDILYQGKEDVRLKPFNIGSASRLKSLQDTVKQLKKAIVSLPSEEKRIFGRPFELNRKDYKSSKKNELFSKKAKEIMEATYSYDLDGIILQPMDEPYQSVLVKKGTKQTLQVTWTNQYKWKPPHLNTVDFLVEKVDTIGVNSLMKLYSSQYDTKTRKLILVPFVLPQMYYTDKDIVLWRQEFNINDEYVFPEDFKMETYMIVPPTQNVVSGTIVECLWTSSKGWTFYRNREEKTSEYKAGNVGGTANNIKTALATFWDILHPLTDDIMYSQEPTNVATNANNENVKNIPSKNKTEPIVYYVNEARKLTEDDKKMLEDLRLFHNAIKSHIIGHQKKGANVLDTAIGKGGDLLKYASIQPKLIVGIDESMTNLKGGPNVDDYAEKRLSQYTKSKNETLRDFFKEMKSKKKIKFIQGDSRLSYASLDAFKNAGEVMVKQAEKLFKGARPKTFDVITCMFAFHYMIDTRGHMITFLQNVYNSLKPGGTFLMTLTDYKQFIDTYGTSYEYTIEGTTPGSILAQFHMEMDTYNALKENDEIPLEKSYAIVTPPSPYIEPHKEHFIRVEELNAICSTIGFSCPKEKTLQKLNTQFVQKQSFGIVEFSAFDELAKEKKLLMHHLEIQNDIVQKLTQFSYYTNYVIVMTK